MDDYTIGMEDKLKVLQERIGKVHDSQENVLLKFDVLARNFDDLKKVVSQFSDKVSGLEEVATDRRKLKTEIKILKNRIDELYAIVKEGKEDGSISSEVGDTQSNNESNHSGFSSSSKVILSLLLSRKFPVIISEIALRISLN